MRSKAFSFLLSLSLMFCVGFGSSLHASALTPNFDQYFCLWAGNTTPYLELKSNDTLLGYGLSTFDSRNHNDQLLRFYASSFNPTSNVTSVRIYKPSGCMDFLYVPEKYDYYLACRFYCTATVSQSTFVPSSMDLIFYNCLPNESQPTFVPIDFNYYHYDVGDITGFQTVSKLPDNLIGQPAGFSMYGSPAKIHSNPTFQVFVIPVEKSSSGGADLSAQILNELQKINSNIEDQYSGDPGSSFPVDDIITQHNEKMGVLSFSSDALMQVLGLLSPDQTLSSELVFPSMSLTIAGQRNKVQLWPEYRFDLNTLKQHWPNFVELMQSLTSALVWIFVLRYCYRVFEKYFLAGGGS